jgi:hypothetical protein
VPHLILSGIVLKSTGQQTLAIRLIQYLPSIDLGILAYNWCQPQREIFARRGCVWQFGSDLIAICTARLAPVQIKLGRAETSHRERTNRLRKSQWVLCRSHGTPFINTMFEVPRDPLSSIGAAIKLLALHQTVDTLQRLQHDISNCCDNLPRQTP